MIIKDFILDFENKKIKSRSKNSKTKYSMKQFYSFLQDIFDEPENMRYDIPIVAKSKDEFELINGWTIDPKALKLLTGGYLKTNH
jgi:hypothetical protein